MRFADTVLVLAAARWVQASVKSTTIKEGVYYKGFYWNDVPAMRREISRRSSGDENVDWLPFLVKQWRQGRPFERVLSLSCGDGSIERWLFTEGGLKGTLLALDFLPELLKKARREARRIHMNNVTYMQHDINLDALPAGPFDLVLVHAGAHHWGRIDRVMRHIASVLPPDGLFVMKEFVGPHRNQYPSQMWQAALRANEILPAKFRNDMHYPHLPTMLATDPSEAQHSELIMPTLRRYFYVSLYKPLCGALAYPVLTHNSRLCAYYRSLVSKRSKPGNETAPASDPEHASIERAVSQLMAADWEYCQEDPEGRSLFAFVIAQPLRGGVPSPKYAHILEDSEATLERAGTRSTYYTFTEPAKQEYSFKRAR